MSEILTNHETPPGNEVRVGSTVVIRFLGESDDTFDNTEVIKIVDRYSEDNTDTTIQPVSPGTPIGKVIIGKKEGEIITYYAAENEAVIVEIVSVR